MAQLNSIKIKNFRNIKEVTLSFTPGYNLLIGKNGQGKTNLLEAIYYLSLLRSFRTSSIQHLKNWKNSDFFFLDGHIESELGSKNLKIGYGEKKVLRINNSEMSKASDFIGHLICIVFSPTDIKLVEGSRKGRRQFLDITLTQIEKEYLFSLQRFNNALKNRNALLKQSQEVDVFKILKSFDIIMIESAAEIHLKRLDLVTEINKQLALKSTHFYGDDKKLTINLVSNTASKKLLTKSEVMKSYEKALEKNLERDLIRGTTGYGPHHDDFTFNLNRKSLRYFGSQGECRLASLLLRLSCSEFFLEHHNCIFLVDDVTGELDDRVKKIFFELLEKGEQVFFAATSIPNNLKDREDVRVFSVESGLIREVNCD